MKPQEGKEGHPGSHVAATKEMQSRLFWGKNPIWKEKNVAGRWILAFQVPFGTHLDDHTKSMCGYQLFQPLVCFPNVTVNIFNNYREEER